MKWGERMDIWKELQDEGIDAALLEEIRHFREAHPVPPEAAARIPVPQCLYYGKEVWESAAAALLCGQHLLLAGPKATGKNVLAENLAAVFGRPVWDVSMYVNVDAAALIGADTLQKGEVVFREGPICRCARLGGFGVLDEVNMAKNEALVSRFVVLDMPVISDADLQKLLRRTFPDLTPRWAEQFALLFHDLRQKCDSGEISTKTLDLRGLLAALRLIREGIPTGQALKLGIINKAFEPFERQLAADTVWARIPQDAGRSQLFGV